MSALKRLLKMLMHLLCTRQLLLGYSSYARPRASPLFRNHFALTSSLSVPVMIGS